MMILLNGFTVRFNDRYENIPYLNEKNENRTHSLNRDKVMLYQLSYFPDKFIFTQVYYTSEKRRLELPLQV